jgi:hypothetical protein
MTNNVSSEAVTPSRRRNGCARLCLAVMAYWLALGPAAGAEVIEPRAEMWPPVVGATEIVISDELSGFGLRGFDPVTFFVDDAPQPGLHRQELIWNGVAWRFASAANREAFRRDPEVYTPRLGGHDPVAAAEGRLVAAEPTRFATRDGRLYLFRSEASRRRFLADGSIARRAETQWHELKRDLVRF